MRLVGVRVTKRYKEDADSMLFQSISLVFKDPKNSTSQEVEFAYAGFMEVGKPLSPAGGVATIRWG
jgi:hypothetical protein